MARTIDVAIPGDKSITQRALILAALAEGESHLSGVLPSADPIATAGALRALGAEIPPLSGADLRIRGVGMRGFRTPEQPLDFQNSGTGARLMMGVLAGLGLEATLTGDESLRSRPMRRITEPLTQMGARFEELGEADRLPIRTVGGEIESIEYASPVASAQVKSAVLFAGLTSGVPVAVHEPGPSRDHTERMFGALGARVETVEDEAGSGRRVLLHSSPRTLPPLEVEIPSDFSSAAFFLVLGSLLSPGIVLRMTNVGLNPTRTGLLAVLKRMGARIHRSEERMQAGEPVGTLTVEYAELRATEVGAEEIPAMIDEVPVLAIAAARATGTTRITGAAELRVKETDRLHALEQNLQAVGVPVRAFDDGLEVEGGSVPLTGAVESFHDHRIAMAFGVLGALSGNAIEVRGAECVAVSFPRFWESVEAIGHESEVESQAEAQAEAESEANGGEAESDQAPRDPGIVITIDGPAGSGKSTTAQEIAKRLGYRHMNSGHLYRGMTYALLDRGIDDRRWSEMSEEEFEALDVDLAPSDGGFAVRVAGRIVEGELVTPEVTSRVSEVSALPAIREWALGRQRATARHGSLVTDGRDMGTTVFPDADLKIFLIADPGERARRRLVQKGSDPTTLTEDVLDEERVRIETRDRKDSERSVSPLRPAEDAIVLDTTRLSFEEQVREVLQRHAEVVGE